MRRLPALLIAALLVRASQGLAEYKEVAVMNGGAITGHVKFSGEPPRLPPEPVFKHHEVCGDAVADQRLEVGNNGALRGVVVSLTNINAGKAIPRERPVKLDNVKCAFVPHVLSATTGQMIEIHNSDSFLHDAHAQLGSQTLFNVAIPQGRTVRKPLAYAGLVSINCNVRHTWMHAYLYVAEHPYHAVTDASGQFVIDQIPPGTYKLRAWHELAGTIERDVSVESGKTATVDLTLPGAAPEAP